MKKMKTIKFIVLGLAILLMTSCTENYSNGERIGLVTQFSKTGLLFKTLDVNASPVVTVQGELISARKALVFSIIF